MCGLRVRCGLGRGDGRRPPVLLAGAGDQPGGHGTGRWLDSHARAGRRTDRISAARDGGTYRPSRCHPGARRRGRGRPVDTAHAPRSTERARAPFARIVDGPGLPTSVAERLACSGRIRTAVRGREEGGRSDVLDLGRSHRLVTSRQCRAPKVRDGDHCAYPVCRRRAGLEAHHVQHWLYGGRTDLDNLIPLCKAHHLAHHKGEFSIRPLGRGRFRFHRDGDEPPGELPITAGAQAPRRRTRRRRTRRAAGRTRACRPCTPGCRPSRARASRAGCRPGPSAPTTGPSRGR